MKQSSERGPQIHNTKPEFQKAMGSFKIEAEWVHDKVVSSGRGNRQM